MRRPALLLLAVLCCAALSSCAPAAPQEAPVSRVQVYIIEDESYTVVDNGQWVEPGSSVTFRLAVGASCLITGADYGGDYSLTEQKGYTVLTVNDVRFPTRIQLKTQAVDLSRRYLRTVTYHSNGGEGEVFSITGSIQAHTRPNTAQGGFEREGFTLTGWNTSPAGDGLAVGLGSRVTVEPEGLDLYAVWAPWSDSGDFTWEETEGGVRITGYAGSGSELVIPARLGGGEVRSIAAGAFRGCGAERVILPSTPLTLENGAFEGCALRELVLFDSIEAVGDGAFPGCDRLQTLRINAAEDPYGYSYRRESLLADKVDLLIDSQGQRKMVFYGGCSIWYNLIGSEAVHKFSPDYHIINMGVNGTVNSLVQMEIICSFLEEGDIFFHTPELSSVHQLLTYTDMYDGDDKLWSGLEYNYDLFALVDIRGMEGVLDSLNTYLGKKKPGGSYNDEYRDASGASYLDYTGSIPIIRTQTKPELSDEVRLDPEKLADGLPTLGEMYRKYREKGVRVYVSYACVDVDGLPDDQRGNVELMDDLFRQTIRAMDGPVLVSRLSDFLYHKEDFFDTHYHLLTQGAYQCTRQWLLDLEAQMRQDGLWS